MILPTGDELRDGTVTDTDGPAIEAILLESFPGCTVTSAPPVADHGTAIAHAVRGCVEQGAQLVVVVGGTGGGRRHVASLAQDCTSDALLGCLDPAESVALEGTNGHLLSKLVAGCLGDCLVVCVPGPHVEAIAAARALAGCLEQGAVEAREVVSRMGKAVLATYPEGETRT